MNLRSGFGAVLLVSLALTPVAIAHPDHEDEENRRRRVPVKIQPATPPVPAPAAEAKRELPKIRFAEMDKDGDRQITRKEWRGRGSSFRKLDRNKDGVLAGVEVQVPVKTQTK